MSFPRYPTYKDSGVEWLGGVPQGWEVKPVKRAARLITQKAETRTFPVALENIEGWSGRFIEVDGSYEGDGVAFSGGDILFGKLRPYLAKAWLSDRAGEAIGDFHVLRTRGDFSPEFLQKVILTREIVSLIDGSTFGAKMPRASWEFMGNLRIPFPPREEQAAITAFLDREIGKIDTLVVEQECLIGLLKEKWRAVVDQAVTRGLDLTVPTKDSGSEWLGHVPQHWIVSRVKSVSSFTTSGPRGWSDRVGEEGHLFIQSGDLNDSLGIEYASAKRVQVAEDAEAVRTRLQDGDVVVCITGAKTGNVALCGSIPEPAYVNQHLCLIRPTREVLPIDLSP